MDRYRATECYRVFADLDQHRCESTYEYFERFQWYMDEYPNHGLQLHELLNHFLNGMRMKEHYILDTMAGGSIMDRTPTEVWYLIQDRAAETRPYTQYIYSQQSHEVKAHQLALARQAAAIAYYKAEFEAEIVELNKGLEESAEDKREQLSAPEPTHLSSDDEEVTVSIEERAAEDTKDEELQVVPMTSVEDVPTEEWISPQCSDLIIKQDTVITCSPVILPISDIRLSPLAQNDTIHKALRNIQVWGSLQICKIHIPIVRTSMKMQKLEQLLKGSCINWKFRKKREEKMGGSSRKVAFRTQRACATQRLRKLIERLHRTWKRRKKGKRISLNKEASLFLVHLQKSHSTFGWKPGWNAWRSVSRQVARNVRKPVRKFDGVHPWSPNIS